LGLPRLPDPYYLDQAKVSGPRWLRLASLADP
jgi:hypothetical protein